MMAGPIVRHNQDIGRQAAGVLGWERLFYWMTELWRDANDDSQNTEQRLLSDRVREESEGKGEKDNGAIPAAERPDFTNKKTSE